MNRKIKFAFLASILLNVLLAGVILGELPRRFDASASRQQRMEKRLEQLPEPTQSRLREKMDAMRKDVQPIRDEIQDAREEAIRILTTEPFDEAGYDRHVNRINELRQQTGKRMAEVFKEVAKESPLQERKRLAEMIRRPPAR